MKPDLNWGVRCTAKCSKGQTLRECVTPTEHLDACVARFAKDFAEIDLKDVYIEKLCADKYQEENSTTTPADESGPNVRDTDPYAQDETHTNAESAIEQSIKTMWDDLEILGNALTKRLSELAAMDK